MSFWKSKKRGLSSDLLWRCIYNHCPARERGYWSCCLLMMYQYRMLMCQYITLWEAARAALNSSTASTCSATLQCWAYIKFPSVCCCWGTSPWAASHGCSASRWARRERKRTTTKANTTKRCVIFTARTEQGRITIKNFSPLHSKSVSVCAYYISTANPLPKQPRNFFQWTLKSASSTCVPWYLSTQKKWS